MGRNKSMKTQKTTPAQPVDLPRLVRPWVGKLHHSRELCDDWGFIRDESGKLIITVPVTVPHEEWAEHRRNNTDPTQPTVDAILDALNRPNDQSLATAGAGLPKP
jgi:hypothetical protein